MYTITKQKPSAEVLESLGGARNIYIIGCGTCATVCRTGGKAEVVEMKKRLEEAGKAVTGWMVIPTACDSMTRDALEEEAAKLKQSDAVLVMSCAFGVQKVADNSENVVLPALDTLFFGMEGAPGQFSEVCVQCGECVLADTGGICPITICPKGLVNGPCGGTRDGKCEVDSSKDCAWTLIYNRLKKEGRLDRMRRTQKSKNFQAMTRPRRGACAQ
ncbi:MAG: methylenetetrahydrofolate reductase C-terminal domain-containing protein [Chloroflexota bacterium]